MPKIEAELAAANVEMMALRERLAVVEEVARRAGDLALHLGDTAAPSPDDEHADLKRRLHRARYAAEHYQACYAMMIDSFREIHDRYLNVSRELAKRLASERGVREHTLAFEVLLAETRAASSNNPRG